MKKSLNLAFYRPINRPTVYRPTVGGVNVIADLMHAHRHSIILKLIQQNDMHQTKSYIMLTRPCGLDPFSPHFYTLHGYLVYRLWVLGVRGGFNEYPKSMV